MEELQETPTPAPRKSRLPYIIGGILVVLLLAGAAFVGARLLNGQGLPFVSAGGGSGPSLSLGGPVSFKKDPSGKVETSSNHDGPTLEVVVTSQTKIYKDVTMNQFDGPPPEGQKIQQTLEEGSLDEIGQNSMITVWGKKTGDRFIAEILVYSPPAFKVK